MLKKKFFDQFWDIISHTDYQQSGILESFFSTSGLVGLWTHFFLVGIYFIEFSLWMSSSLASTLDADEFSCRSDKKNARGKSMPITIIFRNFIKETDKNEIPRRPDRCCELFDDNMLMRWFLGLVKSVKLNSIIGY